jgi:tyrosyl-tRNA synthetase
MIVDQEGTEVRWQSEWYEGFTLADVFNLASRFTLGQLMAHETFRKRYDEGLPLTIMELMYPLLQAYDSVAIEADVEFGGTDQKFNNLAGRELQRMMGLPPQDVFLVPLLPGTDGRKMGKTFDNTINFVDPPDKMYGKLMSITDEMLITYFTLTTDLPDEEIEEMSRALEEGTVNPRDLKMRLGREIVTQFHGAQAAQEAEREFIRIFRERELPSEIPEHKVKGAGPYPIVDLLVESGLASSKSEARRLIQQGGVRLDGEKVEDIDLLVSTEGEMILQVGKRRFRRLIPP